MADEKTLKICAVTTSRADYGLFYWLWKGIKADPNLEIQIVVTGSHLVPELGDTYLKIEEDGFVIDRKVDMKLTSDSDRALTEATGRAMIKFGEVMQDLNPDLVLLLGDRYELLAPATAALLFGIPIVHMYGGETTMGAIDESVRHALTKMSHIHFTANEEYRQRVIQLGENPNYVFVSGSMGLENIRRMNLLSREDFEQSIDFKLGEKNFMVTYHPVTLEKRMAGEHIGNLLEFFEEMKDAYVIFTMANADGGGREINELVSDWVRKHADRAVVIESLGQLRYLSALQYVDAMVGNSSSGLIEAPQFKIGTINIGERQSTRMRPCSVIDCDNSKKGIRDAFARLYSQEFQLILQEVANPYGDGFSSEKVLEVLREIDPKALLKKKFFDHSLTPST